jgi:hypothetical protein
MGMNEWTVRPFKDVMHRRSTTQDENGLDSHRGALAKGRIRFYVVQLV